MHRSRISIGIAVSLAALVMACGSPKKTEQKGPRRLPLLGEPSVVSKEVNGTYVADTVYPRIPAFRFVDQMGDTITDKDFDGKIYVADFFFTTCPTICPVMKSQMLRVYEAYKDNDRVQLLSHTIDPEHDSVAVLYDYAERLQVSANTWHFVTGVKDSIYAISEYYMVSAQDDPSAPGGYIHSGAFVLIDSQKHIRGYYDGTKPEEVDQLINDIPVLLDEEKQR